ncbi:Fanconi anemia core complex-associated protein 24 isoform X3 [Monodelphis domestica]|uniref:Fanconi anemia core complex-associated protein 24 isoform X3 n=1 Tax=Monodelphis domestica TaxID=13616 RepID=UPI0024E26B0A|nr:Fanconi anemia core complex-associated protein 24 isoform X3 [Monodelphis domestica]
MRGGLLGQLGFGNSYRTGRKKKNRTTLERRTSPRATYLDIVTKGRLSLSLKKAWHQWIFTFLIDSVFFILLKQIWWQEITIKKELFNLEIYFSLLKASNLKGIIIVEKTQMSEQYFTTVQKFVVLELGMTLLPVSNQMEASQLIIQLIHRMISEKNWKDLRELMQSEISRTGRTLYTVTAILYNDYLLKLGCFQQCTDLGQT